MMREYMPGVLNGITGTAVVAASIAVDARYELPFLLSPSLGIALVLAGMAIALWAAIHLKSAILGEVQPRLPILITEGPYKLVRHPVYAGITLGLLCVSLVFRNWLGLLILVAAFVPSAIYRARREAKALAERFPSEYNSYASRTGFMVPRAGRPAR